MIFVQLTSGKMRFLGALLFPRGIIWQVFSNERRMFHNKTRVSLKNSGQGERGVQKNYPGIRRTNEPHKSETFNVILCPLIIRLLRKYFSFLLHSRLFHRAIFLPILFQKLSRKINHPPPRSPTLDRGSKLKVKGLRDPRESENQKWKTLGGALTGSLQRTTELAKCRDAKRRGGI